jgi:cyclic pyranopterin phosphate synthase
MVDSFGRTPDYLRISITDRCNLRCVYCMPPEGVELKSHNSILSFEEILRFCGIMAELGIRRIKVTGGEPLVRKGAASFICGLKAVPGIEQVTLTTNGLLLELLLGRPDAFPDAVNISLDSPDPERFRRITRPGDLAEPCKETAADVEKILSVLDRLLEMEVPVKINCVPVKGFNETDLVPLAGMAKNKKLAVRFIELMPMGNAAGLVPIGRDAVFSLLEKNYGPLIPFPARLGNGPAAYYSIKGFAGKIGFIDPLSHGFCETCNRLRLSSEGVLLSCLSSDIGLDIRSLLRSGVSDRTLAAAITEFTARKPRAHNFSDRYGIPPGKHEKGMFKIGG